MTAPVGRAVLADAITEQTTLDLLLQTATVLAVNVDGTVQVDLAGASLALPKLNSYWAVVGDAVNVLNAAGKRLVIGRAGAHPAPLGRVASTSYSTNGPTGFTAETVTDSITFTAAAGRRYKVTWHGSWVANTAPVTNVFRIRYSTGTSLAVAGALVHARMVRAWTFGEYLDTVLVADVAGIPAGETTIGVTSVAALGSGTIDIRGAADNLRKLIVEDIGV